EHRASDVVALQLWVRVGGRDESPEELGLSHYLEHMLFKGTPTRPPGAIDELIEGLGGTSNAFTSYDYTHYDVVLPAGAMRAGLELLADIGVNASFPPQELESEKKVVFEEMGLVEDDPEKFLGRRLNELAYAPHPYGRPILGTREFIQSPTRELPAEAGVARARPARRLDRGELCRLGEGGTGQRHRAARAPTPRAGGGRDPRGAPSGPRRGRERSRAAAGHHHGRVVLRLRHRDRRGAREVVRPGGDHR